MKYLILEETSTDKLNNRVNNHLEQGWRLQGGVAISPYEAGYRRYCQAMVKYNNYENQKEAQAVEALVEAV